MFYITGDTHGDFGRFYGFCEENRTTKEDVMIILGDVGLNYYGDARDECRKEDAAALPVTFFCIHGNHEKRPEKVESCKIKRFCGGLVWCEEAYPNILYAKDGEVYRLGERDCLVIGGAYSVDKPRRLAWGSPWFEDEQPSQQIKERVERCLAAREYRVDAVLSHTCPLHYEPVEAFLCGVDQSRVDKSTEQWLGELERKMTYEKWYCGHYHIEKAVDKLRFLYESIEIF